MQRGAAAAAHAAAATRRFRRGDLGPAPCAAAKPATRAVARDGAGAAALRVRPVCFVAPIGAMLARGVVDTEIARILPRVTAALKHWDGRALPADDAYAALDRRHSRRARCRDACERRRPASTTTSPDFARFCSAPRGSCPPKSDGFRARGADRDRPEVGGSRNVGRDPSSRRPGHRFLPAGGARSASRRGQCDRRRTGRATRVSQRARAHALDFGRGHARLPAPGLSRRAGDRATAALRAPRCCSSSSCCRSGPRCSSAPSRGWCCCRRKASSTAFCYRSPSSTSRSR